MTSRRTILKATLATAGVASLWPLSQYFYRAQFGRLNAQELSGLRAIPPVEAASLQGAAESMSGESLLAVRPGFSYRAYSATGQLMSDGTQVPGAHDGMGIFGYPYSAHADHLHIVRNHELGESEYPRIEQWRSRHRLVSAATEKKWDKQVDAGGTTTMVIDKSNGQLLKDYVSLTGTLKNCNGGSTPWGSWLSCEETTETPDENANLGEKHGYCFEVAANATELAPADPIISMGRFNHEACALDQDRIVYMTEDRYESCLYRYIPDQRPEATGDLARGGQLAALRIRTQDVDASIRKSLPIRPGISGKPVDTRGDMRKFTGVALPIDWVPIEHRDPDDDTVRYEGHDKGAAQFASGEGAWFADNKIYFTATSGGSAALGQIWVLDPQKQTLTLLFESTGIEELNKPDGITAGHDGSLYLSEDSVRSRIIGIRPDGEAFTFLRNSYNESELTGPSFSPDGRLFFVNLQRPGVTCCVFRDDGQPIQASQII